MKCLLLILSLLTYELHAQADVRGLGNYLIGATTPDSLKKTDFEEEQALVKGTIALPCTHIRVFKATTIDISGILVSDLFLYFYDNVLFKLSCTYTDTLNTAFVLKHGEGKSLPRISVQYCVRREDKLMLIGRRIWQKGDFAAVLIQAEGYNASCRLEEVDRLTISSQRILALASDCELPNPYPFMEEFDSRLNERL
ncbi:hypothetical protein [Spirosoma pollinicola]|uniref:Uncharacterized protein n=1 Tax=Spirosoma pollinicola TaxID=2057025 RepID=A0A2K8YZK2_9BACT|nr:hypothetical protein [Spirosoma pollinicola]AUD03031.1 hypothetical protein CWM47_15025 [Spirosoma pollinicola]